MTEDLASFATNLTPHPLGFWVACGSTEVSYPAGGNDACFSIEDDSFWFQHRNRIIAAVVKQFPPSGPIFDIGGGNGFVARGLEEEGFPVVLVEPGSTGASNAVRRGIKNVICSTSEAAGFRPNVAPGIGLFDVLEHIEDDHEFLLHMRSLLKASGRLYLTVPAYQMLWSAEDDHAGHFRRYSTKSLAKRLVSAGFTIEYLTYFFWFLPLPVLVCRTLPNRFGLRRAVSVEKTRSEHSAPGGLMRSFVSRALDIERKRIQKRKVLPFGSSCLAVARNAQSTN